MALYSKFIIAVGGVIAIVGESLSDGISEADLVKIFTAGVAAVGVFLKANRA